MILEQTQWCIDRLREAGLKRSEFQARCERLMNGKTFCGFGDVRISLWCVYARQQKVAPELAKYFNVTQVYVDGVKK